MRCEVDRSEFVLAAMAPAGTGAFSRVQIQKALFLLDRNIGDLTNGPHFNFRPYYYGPFDAEVYRVLETLEIRGLVAITRDPRQPSPMHTLTSAGLTKGQEELARLDQHMQDYIRNTVTFVRSVTFVELLSAIYHTYPEMAANSVVDRRDLVGYPTGESVALWREYSVNRAGQD